MHTTESNGRWWGEPPLAVFLIASLLAVSAGAVTTGRFGNLAAWVVGATLALVISRVWKTGWAALLTVTPIVLVGSFLDRGQLGVHRWLTLGPLHWNAAFLMLPSACVAVAHLAQERWTLRLATICGALLASQPDASQATALAAAMAVVAIRTRAGRVPAAILAVFAVTAWFRPDPLAPVPEVEGVIGLAWQSSPPVAIVAMVALAGVCAAPLLARNRTAAFALSTYLAVICLMPLAGAFPVPLVGLGLSPVLGILLAGGLLAAGER